MGRRLSQCVGLICLLCHGVIASPLGSRAAANTEQQQRILPSVPSVEQPAPRRLHGRFLHITDFHPDDFYQVHSSTEERDTCHRGHGPAGYYGAETSDCDAPLSLVNATFDWIAAHLKEKVDFVIWTGDSARHDSDDKIPRSAAQVVGSNRWMSDKFVELFSDQDGKHMTIPVVPTLGNNDILPHNILMPGPNKWLQTYTDVWRRFIPEEQRHSFEFGGWFYVEVIPNKLAVFSLNTLYFFDRNAAIDDCHQPSQPGYKQMEWLRIQLRFLRERGMKAILMGHVPPARTASKQLWDETCWQKYTLWLQQYRDVVVGALYGHMNVDHFLLQDTKQVDLATLRSKSKDAFQVRKAMEDELSVESTADYLQELRDDWSKLPPPTAIGDGADRELNKDKKNKKKLRWAERYQLSLVSPSIVPNYFPTLRVVEYNISGMENSPVWSDTFLDRAAASSATPDEQHRMELRDAAGFEGLIAGTSPVEEKNKPQKGKDGKKPKKDKGKQPKDPNLVVPDPPAKTSPPGPAYSPQPLTWTGFVQYYANLTHINNDMTADNGDVDQKTEKDDAGEESWVDWLLRWRQGKHRSKVPKDSKPQPRKFKFEVEYSTFDDKIYSLNDLTVKSFVELAYRMGQKAAKGKATGTGSDEGDDQEDRVASGSEDDIDIDDFGAAGKKNKDKKKKEDKNKKGKKNKAWMHFLQHAFVSTIDKEDLKKLA